MYINPPTGFCLTLCLLLSCGDDDVPLEGFVRVVADDCRTRCALARYDISLQRGSGEQRCTFFSRSGVEGDVDFPLEQLESGEQVQVRVVGYCAGSAASGTCCNDLGACLRAGPKEPGCMSKVTSCGVQFNSPQEVRKYFESNCVSSSTCARCHGLLPVTFTDGIRVDLRLGQVSFCSAPEDAAACPK